MCVFYASAPLSSQRAHWSHLAPSSAIWNENKAVIALATGVWVAYVISLIIGRSISPPPETIRNADNVALVPGAARVRNRA